MEEVKSERWRFRRGVKYTLTFVFVIWFIKISEILTGFDFGSYGILPRTLEGSLGILLAPLIHGDIYHLLSNTFPVLILGIGIFYFYDKIAINVIFLIYMMTGFWVWMAARDAYHIGASGLVYGLLTFILFSGFFRRDRQTLAISFILLVLYGGSFFYGIIPNNPGVSWESHLMGAIAGVFCAVYYRKYKISSEKQHNYATAETNYNYEYVNSISDERKYHYTLDTDKKESAEK